jgi:hypothetical protein
MEVTNANPNILGNSEPPQDLNVDILEDIGKLR